MRDNSWLEQKMYDLWDEYFCDIPRKNKVVIKFGRYAYQTLGSIKYHGSLSLKDKDFETHDDKRITVITITRYFADEQIPEKTVLSTIAHEMVHYAHGFHSPLKQQYRHPHKGGLIKKEMTSRGLGHLYDFSKKWIKGKWPKYLKSQGIKTRTGIQRSVRYIRKNNLVNIIFNF